MGLIPRRAHSPPFKGGVAAQRPGWFVKGRVATLMYSRSAPYFCFDHRGVALLRSLHSWLLRPLRRPVGRFNTELPGVLGVEPLPAGEHHRLSTNDSADRSSAEKAIQNIET